MMNNPLKNNLTLLNALMVLLTGAISQPASADDGQFVNLSTRALVGTGDEVTIGGIIIGEGSRQVAIHARGPELAKLGVSNALADPVLTIINTTEPGNPVELVVNDNWEDDQRQLISDIWGAALPFTAGSLSSAAVLTLEPGNYTAKVEGKDGTTGIALVEVWEVIYDDPVRRDRDALVALYNATDGANWTNNENWGTDAPLEQWHGVTVDDNGRVMELRLSGNALTGKIPAELGGLANLVTLSLDGNQLSGPIPAELGGLTKLTGLSLSSNALTGKIPAELGSLTNLTLLTLAGNAGLSGPLPSSFTGLETLGTLWLLGTGLCAPTDAAFQAWLSGIRSKQGVVNCADGSVE
ncbi:MAG: hypothetical protein F7B06_05750 [Opitutae bacterium]|nr:hypothetical protein [Opitutae bacterium]